MSLADYSSINSETALPDLRYLRRMERIIVPLEYNIVRTRTDYSRESAVDEHIKHLIEAYAPLVGHSAAEERGEYKTEGLRNDSVELGMLISFPRRARTFQRGSTGC